MFSLLTVWRRYIRAPFTWLITLLVTLTLSLPMYLFKVVLPPQDAMWLETVVFIVTIYPLKVITGWAYHRAAVREQRPWGFFSLAVSFVGWGLVQIVLGLYVILLFFTQFIGEHGKGVLFEHHAFLLPVPF